MSDYTEIKLFFENTESCTFYFSFNQKYTFEDLLEYISYNYPEKNICPCYQFQNKISKANSKFEKIDKNSNFKDYIKNKNYKFQAVNLHIYLDKTCECDSIIKNNYKKAKIEIINALNDKLENSTTIDLENSEIKQQLDKEIIDKKNRIDSLEKENEILKQKISGLEKESNDNKKKIISLEEEQVNLKNENNELKSKKELNENQTKEKEEIIVKYKAEIDKLNQDKKLLEIAINGDIDKINQLNNLGVTGEFLKPKENTIKIDTKTNTIISNEKLNKDIVFVDFYDVIIDIKSIKDINKGWEIKMSKRAKEEYKTLKTEKIIKIGVIGNSNKGKSFLLSKISKINLPSGTSIRTEGLSVKYPDLKLYTNRRIVLLDSAGLETPVLKEEEENQKEKETKEEEKIENETKEEENGNSSQLENEEKNEKELFKEKSREKLITELFLQNYIIYNSNILIVVVGILTYSEQKLLNRIKTEIQRAKINRKLFIIHNLITYTTKEQVLDYIDNFLLKSATFSLEEGHKITTSLKEDTGLYFYEKMTEPKIYHLIFANEGSEAGDYFNNFTLKFIENQYADVTDLKSFDVVETIKDKFIELSKEILEKVENPFKKGDFDNSDNNSIKLKGVKNIQLKKCLIDELGFSNLKTNGFEPNYNYYKKDDKIIIRVEAPGNTSIKTNTKHVGEYTIIEIKGNKRKDKEPEKPEDNLFNSREIGTFSLDVPLKTDDYLIKNEKPKIEEKKGLIILEFQLDQKDTDKEFGENLEDDI